MCTSLIIRDANGLVYHGRTNEYASLLPDRLVYFPVGSKIESVKPDGSPDLTEDTIEFSNLVNFFESVERVYPEKKGEKKAEKPKA